VNFDEFSFIYADYLFILIGNFKREFEISLDILKSWHIALNYTSLLKYSLL